MIGLRTERLVLDAPRASDIDAVYRACQDAQIHEWVPLPDPYTLESAEFFVRSYVPHGEASGSYTVWAIRLDDEPLIGVVEVRRDESAGSASLGCWLAAPARGSGYMHEALTRVVEHALDPTGMGFSRLRWEYLLGNETSKRLAESVGFGFDPSTAHEVTFHGRMRHAVVGFLPSGGGGGRRG
jgi:RimJ/RimL family protein N-acetyltransferase